MGASKWSIFLLFELSSLLHAGLCNKRCYFCTYNQNEALLGYECVTTPANFTLGQNIVPCPNDKCFREYMVMTDTGQIYTLSRGCGGGRVDTTETSLQFERHILTCEGDLCNDQPPAGFIKFPNIPVIDKITRHASAFAGKVAKSEDRMLCYSCVYSYHPSGNESCVHDPENVPAPNKVSCATEKMCTEFRQWDLRENHMRSFRRGCDDVTTNSKDNCETDPFWLTCRIYCRGNYCNNGDGTLQKASRSQTFMGATRLRNKAHVPQLFRALYTLGFVVSFW